MGVPHLPWGALSAIRVPPPASLSPSIPPVSFGVTLRPNASAGAAVGSLGGALWGPYGEMLWGLLGRLWGLLGGRCGVFRGGAVGSLWGTLWGL